MMIRIAREITASNQLSLVASSYILHPTGNLFDTPFTQRIGTVAAVSQKPGDFQREKT
jgi:hypothetical protein